MRLTSDELEARMPVWSALASMFADNDVSKTRELRAKLLAASPYSLDDLETILTEEVYPVCWINLGAVEGERPSFPPLWLAANILQRDPNTESSRRLAELARLAVPRSSEWDDTKALFASMRGG
jgi:hypothetical protein